MEENFGGDHSASDATRASGSKRSFDDLEQDENEMLGSKKGCTQVDEGLTTETVLSLRESLHDCKDELASCRAFFTGSLDKLKDELASYQNELESAKAEADKWKSAFKKESFVPARKSPEPQFVIDYIQTLRSSEKSLKEELEIAHMKLAIRDLKSQLEPASMKPTDASSGPSRIVAHLEEELRAANELIAHLNEEQAAKLKVLEKQVENLAKLVLLKLPSSLPPPAPEGDVEHK